MRDLFYGSTHNQREVSPTNFFGGILGFAELAFRSLGFAATDSGLDSATPSFRPPVITTITDFYSTPRRSPPTRSAQEARNIQNTIFSEHPDYQKRRYLQTFKDAGIVFVPGLLNFFPADDFFNRVTSFFGYGGLIIGVAAQNEERSRHGLYSVIGGDERVIQPDWRTELVLVIKRLIKALKDESEPITAAKQLLFVGHSKGGLYLSTNTG